MCDLYHIIYLCLKSAVNRSNVLIVSSLVSCDADSMNYYREKAFHLRIQVLLSNQLDANLERLSEIITHPGMQ